MTLTFYRDRQQAWRWRLRARNGRIVAAAGEGFRRRCDCVRSATLVLRCSELHIAVEPRRHARR